MATKKTLDDAASVVIDAEVTALNRIKAALDAFNGELQSVLDTLPARLSLDARRIANDLKMSISYRISEVPGVIARHTPVESPATEASDAE